MSSSGPGALAGLQGNVFDSAAGEGGLHEVFWSSAWGRAGARVSRNVHRITGFTIEAFLALRNPWLERVHPADAGRIEEAYQRLVLTRTPFDEEFQWQHHDGRYLWIRGHATLRDGSDATVDGVFADITAEKALDEQVRQLQKMEAVGQLAGGMAHDFNNLLAVILANGTLLLDALDPDDTRRPNAIAIMETAERAAALTRQLLAFSRRGRFEQRLFDVNDVIRAAEDMLRRLCGEDVRFAFRLDDAIGNVCADTTGFQQVLINLVVNARDAMPEGGKISVATSQASVGGRHHVRIAISDTGCGMDADTRRRVFEPFFTTKEPGTGTGLGLLTCRRIVQQAGGSISVDSEPGQGTVFEILLPVAAERTPVSPSAAPPVVPPAPDYSGTETILLVEDDDGVRRLVERVLAGLGYRVLSAADAEEAFAMAQDAGQEIDLVVSDIVLAGLNGAAIVSGVQAEFPRTKALLMSGHPTHSLLRDGTLQAGQAFIHKPFLPTALAQKVREVLDA